MQFILLLVAILSNATTLSVTINNTTGVQATIVIPTTTCKHSTKRMLAYDNLKTKEAQSCIIETYIPCDFNATKIKQDNAHARVNRDILYLTKHKRQDAVCRIIISYIGKYFRHEGKFFYPNIEEKDCISTKVKYWSTCKNVDYCNRTITCCNNNYTQKINDCYNMPIISIPQCGTNNKSSCVVITNIKMSVDTAMKPTDESTTNKNLANVITDKSSTLILSVISFLYALNNN